MFQHPLRRPVLQLLEPQLRPALRSKPRAHGPVLPRRLAEEQSRVPGRVPVLDRRSAGQPQRRVLRHYDASHPVDPEAEDHQRGQELRALEGKVCGRRTAGLLGAAFVQADQQRSSRGDHQSANVCPMPEQLSVAQRPHWRWFLLSHTHIVPRSHTPTLIDRLFIQFNFFFFFIAIIFVLNFFLLLLFFI